MAEGECAFEPRLGDAALKGLKTHIYDNDQHTEGVIKNVKQRPYRSMDCDEPALYFDARRKDRRASHRIFVADLEKMNDIVARRKENAHANQLAQEDKAHKTEDSQMNEDFMTEDAVWDTGATGKKGRVQSPTQT